MELHEKLCETPAIPCNAGPGLLGGAGGFEEGLLARRLVAGDHGEAGQHRRAGLQEVAVEVADQRVAAPARPDLGEGDRNLSTTLRQ